MKNFNKLILIIISCFPLLSYSYTQDSLKSFIKNTTNDLKAYFLRTNNNSILGKTYSVNDIYKDYSNNELAANKKYKDKPLRIKATIEQIKEDLFNNAVVIAKLKNAPLGMAFLGVNKDDDRILDLSKGNSVDFVCYFDQFTLDSLHFKQCIFTDQYLDNIIDKLEAQLITVNNKNYKPKSKLELLIVSNIIAVEEYIDELCKGDQSYCSAEKSSKSPLLKDKKIDSFEAIVNQLINKFGDDWYKSLPKIP